MGDPLMQNSGQSFVDRIIQLKIEGMIEESWNNDEEYLTQEDRQWLEDNNAGVTWKWEYFHDLVSKYQGSCQGLTEKDEKFLEEFDMFEELDNCIFMCPNCGWWCEVCEQVAGEWGEDVCQDCAEDQL